MAGSNELCGLDVITEICKKEHIRGNAEILKQLLAEFCESPVTVLVDNSDVNDLGGGVYEIQSIEDPRDGYIAITEDLTFYEYNNGGWGLKFGGVGDFVSSFTDNGDYTYTFTSFDGNTTITIDIPLHSIQEGVGIEVDNTDPKNPIVGLDQATQDSLDLADSAVQPGDLGSAASADVGDFATAAQGAKADIAEGELKLVIEEIDYASDPLIGYRNNVGELIYQSNWRSTDLVRVEKGFVVRYKGIEDSSNVRTLVGYDINKDFVSVLINSANSPTDYIDYTINSDVIKYVSASGRGLPGDVFEFRVKGRITDNVPRYYFIPEKVYAKEGEILFINPYGLVAAHPDDRSVDVISTIPQNTEKSIMYTPGTTDTTIPIYGRNYHGDQIKMGEILVKVAPNADITSPSIPQNFICLGDSLTDGTSSSGIEGAYVNELSRRLTGIGTELLAGSESPSALNLNNIYFRGTLGDQPVKHEGRGGWSAQSYYTSPTGNAFWNPSTSKFDVNYYLTQNNFTAGLTPGGVDVTGSNLTFIILLGWNNVYVHGIEYAAFSLKYLIDIIHSDVPDAKIKIVGLNTPPPMNRKTFTATERLVSPETIMREAIIKTNIFYKEIEDDVNYSSFVEFVPISQSFFPEDSYPDTTKAIYPRNSKEVTVHTDYVHPNGRGYAQIADVLFYNILYNYCRNI